MAVKGPLLCNIEMCSWLLLIFVFYHLFLELHNIFSKHFLIDNVNSSSVNSATMINYDGYQHVYHLLIILGYVCHLYHPVPAIDSNS